MEKNPHHYPEPLLPGTGPAGAPISLWDCPDGLRQGPPEQLWPAASQEVFTPGVVRGPAMSW